MKRLIISREFCRWQELPTHTIKSIFYTFHSEPFRPGNGRFSAFRRLVRSSFQYIVYLFVIFLSMYIYPEIARFCWKYRRFYPGPVSTAVLLSRRRGTQSGEWKKAENRPLYRHFKRSLIFPSFCFSFPCATMNAAKPDPPQTAAGPAAQSVRMNSAQAAGFRVHFQRKYAMLFKDGGRTANETTLWQPLPRRDFPGA